MTSTTIIIGGVAGGMSTATRLRRLDEKATIVVFERGEYVSFANCGLPYYLGGVIPERSSLLLQTPAGLGARFGLDVRVHTEVTAIDPARKLVRTTNVITGETGEERYDNLVLSPGAAPIIPEIPGLNAERMHTLRDVADTDRIADALDRRPERAVIIGGGFIGIEAAENFLRRGIPTTLIQRSGQILGALDIEMAGPLAEHMRAAGVDLRLNTTVVSAEDSLLSLSDGSQIHADLILAAAGVTPETSLAAAAGLRIGSAGGIAVDEQGRTSDPHIFAVGDAAEKMDRVMGEPRLIPLAGLANRHGRIVADVIGGAPGRPDAEGVPRPPRIAPALATAIVEFNGLGAASVGWTEAQIRARGGEPRVIHTHPATHAGYYPGADQIALKLVICPRTDRILGAQAVGASGIDKRIDVIATAMSAGVLASDLADLELAYAPQFGSAKDPVNMLGYIAGNQAAGQDATIQWHELEEELRDGTTFLDVRGGAQLAEGLIPGSTHIPVEMLREAEATLPPGKIIIHCRVGQGAHTAQRLLTQLGREVRNVDGGYVTWKAGTDALAAAESSTLTQS